MASPRDLRPAREPGGGGSVARAEIPVGAVNAFFYAAVGAEHHWVDRLGWSARQWDAYAGRPELETWIVHARGAPAGYAELETRGHIAMFGILPALQGRGLGGHLLTRVTQRAWELGPDRVTLDTCELDSPQALKNYRARGFEVASVAVEPRGRMQRSRV